MLMTIWKWMNLEILHSPYLAVLDTDSYIANPKRLDL
jgi:hypothetical protein